MGKQRNRALDYLVYVAARVLSCVDHVCSWNVRYGVADLVAGIAWRLDAKHRRRALQHVKLSFPDWPAQRVAAVAREAFASMAYMGMEMLLTPRLVLSNTWWRYFRLHNMGEALRLMMRRPSGVILLTGHFGNWEAMGYMTAAVGLPTTTIFRGIDNPLLDGLIRGLREKAGQRVIDKAGATTEAGPFLQGRGVLATACDQDGGWKGVFVDFLGRKASTHKSIGLLAMEYEAPVVVMYCRRRGRRYSFEVGAERVIHPCEWKDRPDPLRWLTQEYTSALERVIRRDPGQYFWVHRRWKNRPPGEPPAPDGIA
jgi:KDO2-lipid IV(A) lauroyltransferase